MKYSSPLAWALAPASALVWAATAAPAPADAPAASAVASISPAPSPEQLNLPQLGEPADAALTPAQEAALGAEVVSQMYRYDYMLEDPELTEYVSALAWKLAAAGLTRPTRVEAFIVRDPRINAFALPGGYLGFNVGLITASSSESELAGVIGHELAHVTQRHIARSANNGGGLESLAMLGAMLAAIIAGSADPDAVLAALALGQSSLYQRQVSFIRAHELEADRIGIQTMANAGFNPEGMSSFFQRLEQSSRLYGSGLPEILRTHPVNTTRIAEARARAASLPPPDYHDSLDYGLMRSRARALVATRPSEPVEFFGSEIASGRDTPANRYGLALALRETGNYERAAATLDPLLEANPRQPTLNLLQASIDLRRNRKDAALDRFQRTLDASPRYAPAILAYADALITAGEPERAREVLLNHEQALGTRNETYRLLAQAANETGNEGEASYQMATYLLDRGDLGGALAQLDAGLRRASLSPQDRAKLSARRAEVREALPRDFNPYQQR